MTIAEGVLMGPYQACRWRFCGLQVPPKQGGQIEQEDYSRSLLPFDADAVQHIRVCCAILAALVLMLKQET